MIDLRDQVRYLLLRFVDRAMVAIAVRMVAGFSRLASGYWLFAVGCLLLAIDTGRYVMHSWSKQLCVFVGSCLLIGCAASGGGDSGASGATMKMAANTCSAQIENDRKQCEQECPTATGDEHFSIQHKIAMQNSACKEECEAASEKQAMTCRASR